MKKTILFLHFIVFLNISFGQTKKYPLIMTSYDVDKLYDTSLVYPYMYVLRNSKNKFTGWYFTLSLSWKNFSIDYIDDGVLFSKDYYNYKENSKNKNYYLSKVNLTNKYIIHFNKNNEIKEINIYGGKVIKTIKYLKNNKFRIRTFTYDNEGNEIIKKEKTSTFIDKELNDALNNMVFPYVLNDYYDLFNSMISRECD